MTPLRTVQNPRRDWDRPLSLAPKIHPKVANFIADEERLFILADAFGSPLNLIFPQIIEENIAAFQDVFNRHRIGGKVYFTTKPNKSLSVVRQAALRDVGVDVSSEEALKVALACGFDAARIECTGPKNPAYLILALQHGVTINADNFDELGQILSLRTSLGIARKTGVFVRLGGFSSPRLKFTPHDGTFGIHVGRAEEVLAFLVDNKDALDFRGFSFHLNESAVEQKIIAIESCLHLTIRARELGLDPVGLNIGGGFDISYAADGAEWYGYVETIKDSLRNYGRSLTWNNGGLGYRFEDGLIKGAPNFIQHYAPSAGTKDLEAYLSAPLSSFDDMTVAQIMSDCLLELYIEPGRALLDQLGVTIGRVNYVKTSMHGETLVGLDMNRSNIHSTQQKLLTDPIVIYGNKKGRAGCPDGVYYTGNLCLSYDMITYNKTFPQYMPEAGDLVLFVNTAPYIMDFVESRTLHQNIAEKVAITEDDGRYRWFRDEVYNPALQNYKKKGD